MADLKSLLSQKQFCAEVLKWTGAFHKPSRVPPELAELKDIAEANRLGHEEGMRAYVRKPFSELIQVLDCPQVCTIDDLLNAFDSQFAIHPDPGEVDFNRFASQMIEQVRCPRRSDPIPVETGFFHPWDQTEPIRIWTGASGISVYISGSLPLASQRHATLAFHPQRMLFFKVEGRCTSNALKSASDEIADILRSVIRSFRMLVQAEQCECTDESTILAVMDDPDSQFPAVVCDHGELFGDFALLPTCLDLCFSAHGAKKKTMHMRVRNAIRLLVESDKQTHEAVGLALVMASLEALICNQKDGIADRLARNVACIVEPIPKFREEAMKVVKQMYNTRSDVLHGEKLEATNEYRRKARLLVAGVLKSVLDYTRFWERLGEPRTQIEFFQDVESAFVQAKSLDGVLESPVRYLWSSKDRLLEPR